MTARTQPIPTYPQPHARRPDLSGLTAAERAELTDFIRRLVNAGGTTPRHLRLVLNEHELRQLVRLEALVRWAPTRPTSAAERWKDANGMEHQIPVIPRIESSVLGIAAALEIPVTLDRDTERPIDRLESIAAALVATEQVIAARVDEHGVATTKGV